MTAFESSMNSIPPSGLADQSKDARVLAMASIQEAREILQQEELTETQINRLFAIMTGEELKLIRNDDHDRKYTGKALLWLEEYGKLLKMNLRAKTKHEELWAMLEKSSEEERAIDNKIDIAWKNAKARSIELTTLRIKEMTETLRSALDSWAFIIRTSLSVEGTMVEMLGPTENKKIDYRGIPNNFGQPNANAGNWPR